MTQNRWQHTCRKVVNAGRSCCFSTLSILPTVSCITNFCIIVHSWQLGSSCNVLASGVNFPEYRLFTCFWMPCISKPSAIKHAATAVLLKCHVFIIATNLIAILLLGFIHAVMAGDAVLNRFQSNRVKSIFLVMGARGGAAKLNQTIFSSITHDEARPLLFDTATTPLFDPFPFPDDGGGGFVVLLVLALESLASLSSWSFGFSENLILFSAKKGVTKEAIGINNVLPLLWVSLSFDSLLFASELESNLSLGVTGFGVDGFFTENLEVVSLILVTVLVSNAGPPTLSLLTDTWLISMFDMSVSLVVLIVLFPAFSDFSNCDLALKARFVNVLKN